MKEHRLQMGLDRAITWYRGVEHKVYILDDDVQTIRLSRVHNPWGTEEVYCVYLAYKDDNEKQHFIDALLGAGFIEDTIVYVGER